MSRRFDEPAPQLGPIAVGAIVRIKGEVPVGEVTHERGGEYVIRWSEASVTHMPVHLANLERVA